MTRSDVTRSDVTSQGKLGGCNHSRTTFIALERQHIRLCDVTFKCRSSHNLQLPARDLVKGEESSETAEISLAGHRPIHKELWPFLHVLIHARSADPLWFVATEKTEKAGP